MENNFIDTQQRIMHHEGFALSRTSGESMRPLIWGSQHLVAVTPIKEEPKIGDLLMFRQSDQNGQKKNIVHRLVSFKKEGDQIVYITRGDNCLGCERVLKHEIIGCVTEIIRNTGYRPWHIIPFKKFTVRDYLYLKYTRFWLSIWPARRIYYLFRAKVQELKNSLISIFNKTGISKQKK